MKNQYDLGYKELFSHAKLVEELIVSFVPLDFVKQMDFSTLERIDKSFVTRSAQRRESDLIWKVNYCGSEAYIYLLIEFQSKNDYWMAMRILRYIMEFYSDLTKNFTGRRRKLPAVFPVMLYNGDFKWTAPDSLEKLIDSHGISEKFLPKFSYFPIVENQFSEEFLFKLNNAVSAIFYAENSDSSDPNDYFSVIASLIREESPEIVSAIEQWLFIIFTKEPEQLAILETFEELKDGIPMVATKIKKFYQNAVEQGKLEGKLEGSAETKFDIARKLKATGHSLHDIMEITGLPFETVESLD